MKRLLFSCAVLAGASFASAAGAWHNQGHMMTAEVAWRHMTPGAQCRAVKLLRSDTTYAMGLDNPTHLPADEALFVNAATWPDRIKGGHSGYFDDGNAPAAQGTVAGNLSAQDIGPADKRLHKYWHYSDYSVTTGNDRGPPWVSAEERIALLSQRLAAPGTPRKVRAYNLAWLLHLVGDVHQPLHAATQYGPAFSHGSDNGGNGVGVTCCSYKHYTELHGFWDGAPGDWDSLATAVATAQALPEPDAALSAKPDPKAWVQESLGYARTAVYVTPVMMAAQGPFVLDPDYVNKATTLAKQQVALGGVRLANLLNGALTWPQAGCPD
jgi:hypothetical protein